MALPSVPLPRGSVEVADEKVEVRGLSRAAALRLGAFDGDADKVENFIVAFGCEISEDEARAWREATSVEVVGPILHKILELSGMGQDSNFQDS